ncbi:MAG TPA: hypothetical protein VGN57_11265 [Pirellulaceae bacterium]|jgi:hypothetical protein|nr:hypothetical protein [Pirellulaceae bacterium]
MTVPDASSPTASTELALAGSSADPSSWLQHQWIVAGVISASAIFVPVPLVDDYLQTKCRRFAVRKTLQAHGREAEIDRFEPYYGGAGGFFAGIGSAALRLPLKLALFPIRKPLRVIRSVRDVPLEIIRMALLGRELDRSLAGRKTGSNGASSPSIDAATIADLRRAFDLAFSRMDFRVLRAATKDAFVASTRMLAAVVAARRRTSSEEGELLNELQRDPAVEAETRKVEAQMARPEILSLFREFDARFEREFQEVRERRLAREASH